MAPGIGYLIPWFILFTKAGMIDTYSALILTHLIVALPLVLWVMIGFFEDVPGDLIEAARIDGCSTPGVLVQKHIVRGLTLGALKG
jgi:multiple sugar transport system permease protein